MRFIIDPVVFNDLPTLCIGVVTAEGMDNRGSVPSIDLLLKEAIGEARAKLQGVNLKEHPAIACYREAFRKLGYNPNKYPSSVEALTWRVAKGGEPPDINPAVNLVNAVSLKYTLPMGAHDLDSADGDIAVRYAKEGEPFTPLGETVAEAIPAGELVYADDREIRTRRWIWRQNERGKVTAASSRIFFPVDGFTDCNQEAVEQAMQELSGHLERFFGVRTKRHFLDRGNCSADL
jgi:DNA/RNA-binding domain of Phe-tRNA-synthetase-like protein